MAKVELKQPIVAEISELLNGAASAVVVDYRGLTVAQDTELRKQLREAGVAYKVYKNTMIKRAAEGTDFAALDPDLEGPTAIAVSKDDATAPAESWLSLLRKQTSLRSKLVLLKVLTMIRRVCRLLQLSRPEKYFSESYWEASSLRSPTSLVCLTRSLSSRAQRLNLLTGPRRTA